MVHKQTFVYRNTRSSFNHSPGITHELNSSSSDHSSWIVQELNLFDLCNTNSVACIESTHGCLWIYPLCACALYRQLIRIAAVEQMANERLVLILHVNDMCSCPTYVRAHVILNYDDLTVYIKSTCVWCTLHTLVCAWNRPHSPLRAHIARDIF